MARNLRHIVSPSVWRTVLSAGVFAVVLVGGIADADARSSVGYAGRTHLQSPPSGGVGCDGGGGCHNQTQTSSVSMSVAITGPSSVAVGATGTYTVTATYAGLGSGDKLGVNAAASGGTLSESFSFLTTVSGEIVHTQDGGTLRTTNTSGVASYTFNWTPGSSTAVAGDTFTLYAVARLGFSGGWRHAANFVVTVPKLNQTITFGAQTSPRTYSPGATFAISPVATSTSGLAITYTSDTSTVCTTPGTTSTTVTMQGAGTCTIRANQNGNANYNAATDVVRSITIDKGNQSVTFGSQVVFPTYAPAGSFNLAPAASASSGLAIVYSSLTPAICTKASSGIVVGILAVGACQIKATQPGNDDWNPAPILATHTRTINISKASQSITYPAQSSKPFVLNGTFSLSAVSATSGLAVTFTSLTPAICTTPGNTTNLVTMLDNGICTIEATQGGDSNYNPAIAVPGDTSLTEIPVAPQLLTRTMGDGRVTFTFGPGANGPSITLYTATCTAFGQTTRVGTSPTPSTPVVVLGLTNGINYSCTLTATNSFGTGPASAPLSAVGSATIVPPLFKSASTYTFNIGVQYTESTFRVISTGTPDATVSRTGALPTGMATAPIAKLPGALSVTGVPAAGTVGNYPLTFQAMNSAGIASQNFTLVVAKGSPVITFPDPADRVYSPTPFALTGTIATSGATLAATNITYSSATPGVCSVSGANVTMLSTGTCSINANSINNATYNLSYNPAPQVAQSFVISQASQSITFGAALPPSRTYAPGLMYTLFPIANTSAGLPVTYASATTNVCDISGMTVSVLAAGNCIIVASQDGNSLYLAAPDAQQTTTINQASQTIAFPAQGAQSYVAGGSFAINELATSTSGLAVEYASTTPAICNVVGSSVQILAVGDCNVSATQTGDANYTAATPVNRNIAINAVAAGAPVLDETQGSDATARLYFTPSGNTGGAPASLYRGTCNPGNITGTSIDSPVVVAGLANNVLYTCTVATQNAAGFSAESNSLTVTPLLRSGAVLWNATCSSCHGATPADARFNAAGNTGTVLQYVRANQADMLASPGMQALSANELANIAQYIQAQLTPIAANTPYVTPVNVDVGLPKHLYLGGVAFTDAEVVTPPAKGTLSAFTGAVITYTPGAGFDGMDTFTYRGKRTSPVLLQGDARTVTITIATPAAPVITSATTLNGVYLQPLNYQITATNSPASFNATGLGGGVNVNVSSGLINGTPMAAGAFNVMVSATNPGGTGNLAVLVTISPANQSITFLAQTQPTQSFAPGGSFAINPLATAPGGAVVYSSLTLSVCTVSGNSVTMVSAGTCTIAANQGGSANYNAALQVTQSVTITASAPGAPTIGVATPGANQITLGFVAPANTGGSPITGYNASCTPSGVGSNPVSPITITGLTNGQTYTCTVTATNAAALTSAPSGSVMVTPTETKVPPLITSNNATTFTVLAPGNFSVTATGTPTPVLTRTGTALPAGVSFVGGTGVLSGTPAAGTVGNYSFSFTATDPSATNPPFNQSFTLTVAKANQTINFANPGARSFSITPFVIAPTATSNLAVTVTSNTTAVCTVAGFNVSTVSAGVCSLTATQTGDGDYNGATAITHAFSVNPAVQSITFGAQASPRNYAFGGSFPISPLPTASSGLPVAANSITSAVCSVSGNATVNILAAGTCTIVATQTGNQNYALATPVPQNITIDAIAPGAPVIGVASGADGQVSIGFTPPANTGGKPITQYTATCNPGGFTGNTSSSPVIVTGLTNGVQYTCLVIATNAQPLNSIASGTVMVTPTSADGAALWTTACAACHGATPVGNQLNGAGNSATVLQHVRSLQGAMLGFGPVQALNGAELAAIAAYIGNNLMPNQVTTAANTPAPIDVSGHIKFTNHVTAPNDNWSAFTSVEVVTPPANGMVSAFAGTSATYTPNNGFSGSDTFTYRGKRASPTVIGDPVQVTVIVQAEAPGITSQGTANGTFGQLFAYQITASGAPTTFGATGLPAGVTVDTVNGAIGGTAQAAGIFNATITATNAGGTGMAPLVINIAKAVQAITFGAQTPPAQSFVPGGSFAINPLASGGASGNSIVYSSTTPGVCQVSGSVTMLSAGICNIAANQAGDTNYLPAPQVIQPVSITAVPPGVPTIGAGTPGNAQAQIGFTPPGQNGGSPIIDYTATCNAPGPITKTGTGSNSPVLVTTLVNGTTYSCSVKARNAAGFSADSATVQVTPALVTVPGMPIIGAATPGNGNASIDFSPPLDNGGAAITQYTATCNPNAVTGSTNASPATVNGLTNGVTYTCTVTATNSAGTGPGSATVDVIPEFPIAFISAKSRKQHGATPYDLPIAAAASIDAIITVEPRAIGTGHKIIFEFTDPVGSVNPAVILDALGVPVTGISATTVPVGNTVEVTITGLADNRRIGIFLFNVGGAGVNATAYAGFLVGDVTGSRSVNAADIGAIKARTGQPISIGNNFLFDVNLSGSISPADVSQAKARAGLVIP